MPVTNQFFVHALDMNWQTSNTRSMKNLADNGWVKIVIGGNKTKFYHLTQKARAWCKENAIRALYHRFEFEQPALFEIEGE